MNQPGGYEGHAGPTGLWARDVDVSFLWRVPREHPAGVIMTIGVVLRVLLYLGNRGYWLDEGSLLDNIIEKRPFEFSGHLASDQLAPFAFLIAERLLAICFGDSGYVMRLIPLACGIGSLWLFRRLAFGWLSYPAAMLALALFAFSDDLIYYSTELKPYSSDLATSLAMLVVADRVRATRLSGRETAGLAVLTVAAPWVSFPSAFVIAGVGLALLADRVRWRDWGDAIRLIGVAAGWLISFAIAYRASHSLLAPATSMYVFWNFAFLAAPPRDLASWRAFGGVLLEVLVNPLGLVTPRQPAAWAGFLVLFLVAGVLSLARRDRTAALMLLLPVALAVLAAVARRYPFHGRLILGLVPAFHLFLADGLDRLRTRVGRPAFLVAAFLLLVPPCWTTLYENSGPRVRDFNPHGDLHRNRFVP